MNGFGFNLACVLKSIPLFIFNFIPYKWLINLPKVMYDSLITSPIIFCWWGAASVCGEFVPVLEEEVLVI